MSKSRSHTYCAASLCQLWHNCLPLSTACLFVWSHCSHSSAQLTGCLGNPRVHISTDPDAKKRSWPFSLRRSLSWDGIYSKGTWTNPLSASLSEQKEWLCCTVLFLFALELSSYSDCIVFSIESGGKKVTTRPETTGETFLREGKLSLWF